MDECPYRCHKELEESVRQCLDARAQTVLIREQIEVLFDRHTDMITAMGLIKDELGNLRHAQHSWAATLLRIGDDVKDLCAGYKETKTEVDKFAWFRDPLNKLQKKLPFFVVGIIMVALISFILPFELTGKMLDLIKKIMGWFK